MASKTCNCHVVYVFDVKETALCKQARSAEGDEAAIER